MVGPGPSRSSGVLDVTANSAMASASLNVGDSYAGTAGSLTIVAPTGELNFDALLQMFGRYRINISGVAPDSTSVGRISADWGTATTINPGGRLELNDDGGYYQGFAVAGQPPGTLTNNGVLAKTGGGSTSIVDAAYTQGPTGSIEVDCCATLALAGQQLIGGQVVPGMSLGTGACGLQTTRSAPAARTPPST